MVDGHEVAEPSPSTFSLRVMPTNQNVDAKWHASLGIFSGSWWKVLVESHSFETHPYIGVSCSQKKCPFMYAS